MKSRTFALTVVALLIAGCAGGLPGSSTKPGSSAGSGATAKPGAQVDCAAMELAAQQLIGIQLLAQLTSPDSIESIKSLGSLDIDKMLSAFATLHALDGVSSPLGDAKASIATYEKAAKAARTLLAMDPVTQAAIDAYNSENVGTIADFLGKQVAISGALDAAGC